jgi:transposase
MINGAGGRRHWSVDDKARIIAETLEPNAIISDVPAGMVFRPQQVFAWRREARKLAASVQQDSPAFVSAVCRGAGSCSQAPHRSSRNGTPPAGAIELEIDGVGFASSAPSGRTQPN